MEETTLDTILIVHEELISTLVLLVAFRAVSGKVEVDCSRGFDEKLSNFVNFYSWSGMPKPVAEVGEGKLISRRQRQFFLGLLSVF